MSDNTTEQLSNFSGLERHHIGRFPILLIPRKETIEQTLTLFKPDYMWGLERNILSRITHLYRVSADFFEQLRQSLIKNSEFVHVEVLHKSSDLGIPYKIFGRHKSGQEIYFDGIMFRISQSIFLEEFNIQQINELTGYISTPHNILNAFKKSLAEVYTELSDGYAIYSFYTIQSTDWEGLGLQTKGNAQLRLICKDMNVMTITSLLYAESGKDYDVYLGERERSLQILAHELAMKVELEQFIRFIDEMRGDVQRVKENTLKELNGVLAPLYRLRLKHLQWLSVKNSYRSLIKTISRTDKMPLVIEAFEKLIEDRVAFFNAPKQIWPANEEHDDQLLIQHPCSNFFEANLVDGKLTDLSDKPVKPGFTREIEVLRRRTNALSEEIQPILENEKTMFTTFQTEFSLYAVWIAVVAFLVSILSIIATLVGD